ncbi:MAG: filamentous hemagglutinin N-terminal domain-containing protein [Chromatocurvus sp.]
MADSGKHLYRLPAPDSVRRGGGAVYLALALALGWQSHSALAEVVFDGSVGPNAAGTTRSGLFEITQNDGEIAGNNLFHSVSSFGVNRGEQATFTHESLGIEHIITRVTGIQPSAINGALQVRHRAGAVLSPTAATLWLMNASGILIGDGANLDAQSTFVFSTANRLGFDNGDDFYTHEPAINSVLSVADPTSFGFLDRQALPANVTARGIEVTAAATADASAILFLSNMTLVGTSLDPMMPGIEMIGNVPPAMDAGSGFPVGGGTRFQSPNLRLGALGAGGSIGVDTLSGQGLRAAADAALGSIVIRDTNLQLSDFGSTSPLGLSVLSERLVVDNTSIETFAFNQSVPVAIRATERVSLSGALLQTSTFSDIDAGDIRIDTRHYEQFGGRISSQNFDLETATGAPGNLLFGSSASLPMQSFLLQQGQIQSLSTQLSQAGDLLLNVQGEVTLTGSSSNTTSLASINAGAGASGDILVFGNRIRAESSELFSAGFNPAGEQQIALQAGSGGLDLVNTSLFALSNGGRTGATINLSSEGDISMVSEEDRLLVSTGTSSDLSGGDIFIAAQGDLSLQGSFSISSDSTGPGDGGIVSLTGRDIELIQTRSEATPTSIGSLTTSSGTGGTIFIAAEEDLVVAGEHVFFSTTAGPGNSGAVILDASTISIDSTVPALLSTSSVGAGDAGIISLNASDSISLSGVGIDSVAAADGAAGFILLSASGIDIEDSTFITATRANDVDDIPAQIFVDAGDTLHLRNSDFQSNSIGRSPAGQVSMNAGDSLQVEDVSIQTATTRDGITGSIFLVSGGDITLQGEDTALLSNSEGVSNAGDVTVLAQGTLLFEGGGFLQTSAVGAGNAGTILLSADTVRIRQSRIEGTSDNGGGGDVNIFGRDIHLDSAPDAGGIVFITASSQSSDAAGNGGSVTLGNPLAPAELILVRTSALLASANAGNGGRININAENFLRDARSTFQVTSTLGDPGSLEINAPQQDISAAVSELDVDILDATELISDRCAVNPEDASSLVVAGPGIVAETFDAYLTSDFQPTATTMPGWGTSSEAHVPETGVRALAWRLEVPCNRF